MDTTNKKGWRDVDLTEFNKLAKMLEEANIPHKNKLFMRGYGNGRQIILLTSKYGSRLADVICHFGSYGHGRGLLEIFGGLTIEEMSEDEVLGWLTAEEVFKRFKYCYEHNTSVYVEEE